MTTSNFLCPNCEYKDDPCPVSDEEITQGCSHFVPDSDQFLVSDSQLSAARKCLAAWYWGYVRRLEKISDKVHLDYGKIFHDILKRIALEYKEGNKLEEIVPRILKPLVAFVNKEPVKVEEGMFENVEWCESEDSTLILPEIKSKTNANAIKLINELIFERDFFKGVEIIATEQMYYRKIAPGVYYRGIVDLIVREADSQLCIADYKTTQRVVMSQFMNLSMDPQMNGYSFLTGIRKIKHCFFHFVKEPDIVQPESHLTDKGVELWDEEQQGLIDDLVNARDVENCTDASWNTLTPREQTECHGGNCLYGCDYEALCVQGRFSEAIVDLGMYREKVVETENN